MRWVSMRVWDECVWNDKDEYEKNDHGVTWVSLTGMIMTFVSIEKVSVTMNDKK